jgi:hypothetical protein
MNQNRTPAKWHKAFDLEQGISVDLSEGGAVRFTQEGQTLIMFPARMLETVSAIFHSLNQEQIDSLVNVAAKSKEKKKVEKEIAKVANQGFKYIQAIKDMAKAKGLDPEETLKELLKAQ